MSFEILYLANNPSIDKMVYETVVPYFSGKKNFQTLSLSDESNSDEYEKLPSNVKRILRDLIYDRHKGDYELDCSKEEFIKLYKFLDFILYNKKEFRPLFMRFLFKNRDDTLFMRETADIHHKRFKMGCNIKTFYTAKLALCQDSNIKEIERLSNENNPYAIHLLAFCLREGIDGCVKNLSESGRLFKLNWSENNFNESGYSYAYMLLEGIGGEKDEVEARRIYKILWDENFYSSALYSYIHCLMNGIGGNKDTVECQRLLKIYKSL